MNAKFLDPRTLIHPGKLAVVSLVLLVSMACDQAEGTDPDDPEATDTTDADTDAEQPGPKEPPVVGTGNGPSFTVNEFAPSLNSQEFAMFTDDGVVWLEGPNPAQILYAEVDENLETSDDPTEIRTESGQSGPGDMHTTAASYGAGSVMTASLTAGNFQFALVGHADNGTDNTEFDLEGPFNYSNEKPGYPQLAKSSDGNIGMVYQSAPAFTTPSNILFKTIAIDGTTVTVDPAATSGEQTGIQISSALRDDAHFPDIAWNPSLQVFGIVYESGAADSKKLHFVSVDADGDVVTEETTLFDNDEIQVQHPRIAPDGDGFVIAWEDFREIKIGEESPIENATVRFAQIDGTGTVSTLTGAAEIFDSEDNSLLLSNPYLVDASIFLDIVTKEAGKTYGVVWSSTTIPQQVFFHEVTISGGEVSSTIQQSISNESLDSTDPKLAYANGKYNVLWTEKENSDFKIMAASN